MSKLTWAESAGRKSKSNTGYRFGDVTRSVLNSVLGARPPESALQRQREERMQTLTELERQIQKSTPEKSSQEVPASQITQPNPSVRRENGLTGAAWPDPDPSVESHTSTIQIDDVTRMNSCSIDRVVFVRSTDDVKRALDAALCTGRRVSMRGTKHTMGGHTIAPQGILLDMARLNFVEYDQESTHVRVGPGLLWCDLIYHLNRFGRSPRTMQSYSTFSIGGAVAVNAHGITTDFCCHESVVELKLVLYDGTEVVCSPTAEGIGRDLFGLAIGGYGMFGVIVELTLKTVPNTHLSTEMIHCDAKSFPRIFSGARRCPEVAIKLARLDITNMRNISLFIFRKADDSDRSTISALPLEPREMSVTNQVLYKWLAPSIKGVRYSLERAMGRAVDWADENERNLLMYESAVPLAKLYSPYYDVDDTFVLQEYFVPESNFECWLQRATPTTTAEHRLISLLNITIRFVEHDTVTALPYSRHPAGCYAFVLYWRIQRSPEADAELEQAHKALAAVTRGLGGVFYLPYRHHYSHEELEAAYPMIEEFFARKQEFDPHGVFASMWSDAYGAKYMTSLSPCPSAVALPVASHQPTFVLPEVSVRRTDSYHKLMRSSQLRQAFFEGFLVKIFNLVDPHILQGMISKAVLDIANEDGDRDVYVDLRDQLAASDSTAGVKAQVVTKWRALKQLRAQKNELLRETAVLLSRLGRLNSISDYVSIGDHGKLVLPFREVLGIRGKVYVVNDTEPTTMEAQLERGSDEPVGTHVHVNFQQPHIIPGLPAECSDLVTMNQGLHHLPPDTVIPFVARVFDMLRPGGLFIVREHNASPELIPLLDLAHSVFNVVTGVSVHDERTEIRAFRSVLEWRAIIESTGFLDTMVYEMEPGDVTVDEMMCFMKPMHPTQKLEPICSLRPLAVDPESVMEQQADSEATADADSTDSGDALPPIAPAFVRTSSGTGSLPLPAPAVTAVDALLDQGPAVLLELVRSLTDSLWAGLDKAEGVVDSLSGLTAGQKFIAQGAVKQLVGPLREMIRAFRPYLESMKLRPMTSGLVPPELMLAIKLLLKKGEAGEASAAEMAVISVIKDVLAMLSEMSKAQASVPSVVGKGATAAGGGEGGDASASGGVDASDVAQVLQALLDAMPALRDPNLMERLQLSERLKLLVQARLGVGPWTAASLADHLVPVLDTASWQRLKAALTTITAAPAEHQVQTNSLDDATSSWTQALKAVLGSRHVVFSTSQRTMLSWMGYKRLVTLWREAQAEAKTMEGAEAARRSGAVSLTPLQRQHLQESVTLAHDGAHAAGGAPRHLDKVVHSCRLNGLLTSEDNPQVELTWFKLPEWLQVELVQAFGSFMEHTPWYQFPFMATLGSYFRILWHEMRTVLNHHGLRRAVFSRGFITDLLPGIAMVVIFGQMATMALPLRLALGDEYSEEKVESQVEELLVTYPPGMQRVDWMAMLGVQRAEQVVYGLDRVFVKSFKPFSEFVQSQLPRLPAGVVVVRISGHDEVQVRIQADSASHADAVGAITGCEEQFRFRLPTDGSQQEAKLNVALRVDVNELVEVMKALDSQPGVDVVQIYDFWA